MAVGMGSGIRNLAQALRLYAKTKEMEQIRRIKEEAIKDIMVKLTKEK